MLKLNPPHVEVVIEAINNGFGESGLHTQFHVVTNGKKSTGALFGATDESTRK